MKNTDPRVDTYIAKSATFAQPILTHLRAVVHRHMPETTETIKWGFPHFDYNGGIFCSMASFKQHCAFGFWLGNLLSIDEKSTKAMGQFGRITSLADLPSDATIGKLIKQARTLHDHGAKGPTRLRQAKPDLVVPDSFMAALKKNKRAQATFEAFPTGQKREYVEWYTEAKAEPTRERRMAQALEWMAEGKVRNWKYLKC